MFFHCRIVALVLLLASALLPGCGRKTALIPPQQLVPVAINDLRHTLDENGVTLKWTYPAKMENGDELSAIESFEILRAKIPADQFCDGCPVQFEEPVEIDGGYLPASGESRTAEYSEGHLQEGYHYLYKVRSRAGWWYPSSDSNVISFTWRVPPKAPRGLQVESGDRTLTLSWEPVRENMEGDPLGATPRYRVYRKKGEAQFIELDEYVQEPEFIDSGLENEQAYFYKVRAFVQLAETLLAGEASQVLSGVPRDLTPPPPVQNLVAIATPAGVKLAWQSVTGGDLAGYRIYRREEHAKKPELVAEVGIDQNQYVDQNENSGRKWFYSVTSFDKAEPENESMPATEAVVDLQ